VNLDFLGSAASAIGGGGSSSGLSGIGNLVGSAIPLPFASQIGGAAGALLDKAGSLFSGDKVGSAKGMFDGHHSTKYQPLDDSRFSKEDANKFISIAARPGISVEEAAIMMGREVSRTGQPANVIWDGFSAGSSYIGNSAAEVATIIAKQYDYWGEYPALVMYDRKPQTVTLSRSAADGGSVSEAVPMLTSMQRDLAAKGIGTQVIQATPTPTIALDGVGSQIQEGMPTNTSANNFLGMSKDDINKILQGGASGLQKGVIDAAMQTGIGKQAQSSGAKQWANDNGLIIGGVIAVLGCGFTYLIATRK
jgi:hypothetical protein